MARVDYAAIPSLTSAGTAASLVNFGVDDNDRSGRGAVALDTALSIYVTEEQQSILGGCGFPQRRRAPDLASVRGATAS